MIIKEIDESEILGLNLLPPADWDFDYETFLRGYIAEDFFYAFVMVEDKEIIGTANVLLSDNIGWLANIIIVENHRGKGLGYTLTKHLVDFLSDKNCETQILIANELGEPVYRKLGFRKITDYHCFDSVVDTEVALGDSVRALKTSDLKKVYELDQEANAENRTHLIDLHFENGLGYFSNEELLGVYLPGFNRGLVLSRDKQAGIELLKIKHASKGSRSLIPSDNLEGIQFLENSGLKKGDKCSRMILGKDNKWNPSFIYSYGSGYCG